MSLTSADIRRQFLDFFKSKDHAIVPSAPVVPLDDPTLMFTNAGMNQFKDVFLGTGSRPYRRAADTQKCIRAGGKHNDLDDVGQDTYHHTFFEMLGNWSFGDYFKAEAIQWAWELLTGVWGIEKDRLYATYFEGDPAEDLGPDTEARDLWLQILPPERVHAGNKKDNFWEMGDVGPCGPCSEIHIDLTPDKSGASLVNAGDARVIEIWNLVFIQYAASWLTGGEARIRDWDSTSESERAAKFSERKRDELLAKCRKLELLPAKHVDTGMGFERVTAVLQGMDRGKIGQVSNYDTDIFTPIFGAIRKRTGAPAYTGSLPTKAETAPASAALKPQAPSPKPSSDTQTMVDVSYRVIADHLRCLTFALTDGAVPSNEGRGYILRRILRRAVRYGRQYFGMHEPFLFDLVEPLVVSMSGAFPELRTAHGGANTEHVLNIIRNEEESFGRTIDRGIKLFDMEAWHTLVNTLPRSDLVEQFEVYDRDQNVSISKQVYDRRQDRSAPRARIRLCLQDSNSSVIREYYSSPPTIPGNVAFRLHDTYGFPIDLTQQMAHERGLCVDIREYERLMEEARGRARAAGSTAGDFDFNITTQMPSTDDELKYLDWLPGAIQHAYGMYQQPATLLGFVQDGRYVTEGEVPADQTVGLVLDRTAFYGEQGGQIGDTGQIELAHDVPVDGPTPTFRVQDTKRFGDTILHIGRMTAGEATLRAGQKVSFRVDVPARSATMQNHTATHMLNWALREVLGDTVQQKGSLVDAEKTRFDFSHNKALTIDELTRVEALVNQQIAADLPVHTKVVSQQKAREINTLRAVFGEKYPDQVRVVSIGAEVEAMLADPKNATWMQHAVEFCGGTHLSHTGEAEHFVLTSEEAVAKGIRRVVGITGQAARSAEDAGRKLLKQLSSIESSSGEALSQLLADFQGQVAAATIPIRVRHEIRERLAALQQRAKDAEKQRAAETGGAVKERVAELLSSSQVVGGTAVVVGEVPPAGPDALRGAIDWVRNKTESSAVLLAMTDGEKVTLVAGMTNDIIKRGVKAGDLIKHVAPIVGGRGGGRPDMAQGGGTDASKLADALTAARTWLTEKLS